MLTSKQRARLRAIANGIDAIFQVGKGGLGESFYDQIDAALEKRELIKASVLETALMDTREVAADIAQHCGAEVVQVIGSRFVLYRASAEPKINL